MTTKDLGFGEIGGVGFGFYVVERDEEDLLAKVDSDVSREVPSAMEPLAQMMSDDDTK